MPITSRFLLSVLSFVIGGMALANERVLDSQMHHLRLGDRPEWNEFSKQVEGPKLTLKFQTERNASEWALRYRQQDVKQTWKLLLNGKELARLRPDENDMVLFLPVPAGALTNGENTLAIEQVDKTPDDIRIGEITLSDRSVRDVLADASVEIDVLGLVQASSLAPIPCRITVLNDQGALMTMAAVGEKLAVRPGVIYTATGVARFSLPAGEYTIYAGHGIEFSVDEVRVALKSGDAVRKQLSIRREVPISGYISCDPHIHTLTYSGHGDASVDEQVLAIAGEGIELPIATEHNRHIDYHAAAVRQGVRQYFTPVVGNEVTTDVGHFNIFPVHTDGPVPEFQTKDWKHLFDNINRSGAKVVILNHPRDLHSGYRPFGPEHYNAATGENLDGWVLRANAMEVVNSGAQQTDVLLPCRDWFALLNRGVFLTPAGASDSHDVARYFVGQARTYIRCRHDKPGEIDVEEAVRNFLAGRVLVSCGLLAEMTVNDKYGPGDLAPASGELKVAVRVTGPGWATADKVELYANGIKIREARILEGQRPGVKWSGKWTLPRFWHDTHLVAIATGPGIKDLYWPIAKPYQPASSIVSRRVMSCTGVVWINADGNGKRTSAFEYAQRLLRVAGGEPEKAVLALGKYDEAVAAQVAGLLQARGFSLREGALREAAQKAGRHVERGFEAFLEAHRESQIARGQAQ